MFLLVVGKLGVVGVETEDEDELTVNSFFFVLSFS